MTGVDAGAARPPHGTTGPDGAPAGLRHPGGARTVAPAKVNPILLVGPVRPEDGRHDLLSLMQSLTLADDVALVPGAAGQAADEVDCPGIPGDNLALHALSAFRAATGWAAPPLTVRIVKRIPVAAGMAGGSTDAAAVLRLAAHLSGVDDPDLLQRLAAGLGADVPHGLEPGLATAEGMGDRLTRHARVLPGAVVVVRAPVGLSTPTVFRRADELRPPRTAEDLASWRARVADVLDDTAAGAPYPAELAVNDLADAAVDLAPVVGTALRALREAGAQPAMVSGSGPTTVGWFADEPAAERAAATLRADGLAAESAVPSSGAPIEPVAA
jgi:4-diphosphocytidyl-2-C-methyl-D-erythritol kinase